jgi:hypothetical protein
MNTLLNQTKGSQSRSTRSAALLILGVALFLGFGALDLASAQTSDPCGGKGRIDSVTNTGTEFLLVYDQNEKPDYTDSAYQDIFIACLDSAAQVTITCRQFPMYSKVINLAKRASISYRLSAEAALNFNVLVNSNEVVDNTVVHVVSTAPIICYGMSHKVFTTDAFLAFPKTSASVDYRVMSYENSSITTDGGRQSEFSVASFYDDDTITVTPTAETISGNAAGTTQKYVLQTGQCVQIQANPLKLLLDMTGSHVTSTKPCVVFGAHVRAEVPEGYSINNTGNTSRDYLEEELPPVSTWGTQFVCSNFTPRTQGDVLRVQALNDNTIVKIGGVVWGNPLNHDQSRDTLITGPVAVESGNSPVLVGMFCHTATNNLGEGDPFFAIVPPVNQTYNDFTFFTSPDVSYTENYVAIAAELSAVGKIVLDGNLIPTTSFTTITTALNGTNYAVATVSVPPGSHLIRTTNAPAQGFTILAYGFGKVDSYGYTAGAVLKPLRGIVATGGGLVPAASDAGSKKSTIHIRNILASELYLDSAVVELDGYAKHLYTATIHEPIDFDHSRMEMNEERDMHIDVTPPNTEPLTGTVKFYSHSPRWFDLASSDIRVQILPPVANGVSVGAQATNISTSYPNPFTGFTTITYTLDQKADLTLRVYDDLGRLVQELVNGENFAGTHSIRFEKTGLAAGHYTYELHSVKLGINERHSLVLAR